MWRLLPLFPHYRRSFLALGETFLYNMPISFDIIIFPRHVIYSTHPAMVTPALVLITASRAMTLSIHRLCFRRTIADDYADAPSRLITRSKARKNAMRPFMFLDDAHDAAVDDGAICDAHFVASAAFRADACRLRAARPIRQNRIASIIA